MASRFRSCWPRSGILPGIKVDAGAKALAGFPGETVTEGLDGLRERLAEYYGLGRASRSGARSSTSARRSRRLPASSANADALARYAALCQEASIVPIVEPEVLMDGDHSIARCEEVTDATLETVFDALFLHRVRLEGMVLKPNMVIAGKKCAKQAKPEEVAEATVRCLLRRVPAAVPGIAFLSGGQSEAEATAAPVAHERARASSLGALLQLWPRAPAEHARCLEGQARQRRRGAEDVPAPARS